jgi:arylsulfatase A-like enzyme
MANSSGFSRSNILLVICHDLGRRLGCYGGPVRSPNLDRAACDGVVFTNYFCTAAQCSPSRGSIITGRFPHRNGLMGLAHIGWELNDGENTLPMYLNQTGYSTHLFGLQHESADPSRLGYQHLHLHEGSGAARVAAAEVAAFLRHAARTADTPFYACVGIGEPHRPYHRPGYPADDPEQVQPLPYLPDRPGIRDDLAHLDGLISAVDEAISQILAALEETGLSGNTLFIFTTDHGIAMPRAKGTCYDPGIETALIMRLPGRFARGVQRGELLSNVDLLPTLLELAGCEIPRDLDGYSFLPLLTGGSYRPRDHIFIEMTWHDKYNPMRGIRTQAYKYVCNFGDRPLVFLPLDVYLGRAGEEVRDEFYACSRPAEELYDLGDDPLEQRNLAADPSHCAALEELRRRVQEWMELTGDPLLSGPVEPPPKQRERLARGEPNDWPRRAAV